MEALEYNMLWWAETYLISKAIQQQDFTEIELKKKYFAILDSIKDRELSAYSPTVKDDVVVISQLEMDTLSSSMLVKVKRKE